MPGILPMKVIKMGTSANARIAQACDRCRSKKIRCDGIRPCCSQCSQVGFECKTSDKLSRRAFPRGYTESLEERVRSLETEVRELKDVLDEKDEKIDMLSRIHPTRLCSSRTRSVSSDVVKSLASADVTVSPDAKSVDSDDITFKVQQPPSLTEGTNSESYYAGASSGTSLVEAFKHKVQEKGRSATDIRPSQLLKSASQQATRSIATTLTPLQSRAPPRLTSDQLVNVFFQEWAPLFPILHRPTFLTLYEDFTKSQDRVTDKKSVAQLYLVFALAALSQGTTYQAEIASLELQWQSAMQHVQFEQSFAALQCLVLAQLYCMQKGDCSQMLTYKALAISLSSRLGLHHSQKRFAFGTLTCELRKRAYWTLYTIDSFSAVQLGLPQQIKDTEVLCEMPADTDDEYITEKGFQSVPPGESTRVSSALALFRAARILSKVLTELYPGQPTYELSVRQVAALGDELDAWLSSLAPHLRLPFAQDKPTAGTVSSRSPILSLVYHLIRCMIHRPAATSASKVAASSSTLALASSSKHVAQILGLLTERGLCFSFCINKEELLVLSGFGLLLQGLNLDNGSKILKDNHKTLALIIGQLDKMKASVGSEFRRVASSFLPTSSTRGMDASPGPAHAPVKRASEGSMPPPHSSTIPANIKEQFKAMTSKLSLSEQRPLKEQQRRMTTTGTHPYRNAQYAQSQPVILPHSTQSRQSSSISPQIIQSNPSHAQPQYFAGDSYAIQSRPGLNLDYLNFSSVPAMPELQQRNGEWERLLGSIDNGQTNIFDNIYGGPPMEVLSHEPEMHKHMHRHSLANVDESLAWNPDVWAVNGTEAPQVMTSPVNPESVISFSSEDGAGYGSGVSHLQDDSSSIHDLESFRGIVMPELVSVENGIWDRSLEHAFAMS